MKASATGENDLVIESVHLKQGAMQYRAINNPLRQKILRLLHTRERLTVTEVYVTLKLEQSVASQQLAILRRAGFVSTERVGKFIYYFVNYDRLNQIHSITKDLLH